MRLIQRKGLPIVISVMMFLVGMLPAWADTQQDIESSLICPACFDDGMLVSACPDSTAAQIKKEIAEQLAAGKTKTQIVDVYVSQYGRKILSTPPASGFDLVAWITPFAAICAGGGVMYLVLNKWTHSPSVVKNDISPKMVACRTVEEDLYADNLDEQTKKYI